AGFDLAEVLDHHIACHQGGVGLLSAQRRVGTFREGGLGVPDTQALADLVDVIGESVASLGVHEELIQGVIDSGEHDRVLVVFILQDDIHIGDGLGFRTVEAFIHNVFCNAHSSSSPVRSSQKNPCGARVNTHWRSPMVGKYCPPETSRGVMPANSLRSRATACGSFDMLLTHRMVWPLYSRRKVSTASLVESVSR